MLLFCTRCGSVRCKGCCIVFSCCLLCCVVVHRLATASGLRTARRRGPYSSTWLMECCYVNFWVNRISPVTGLISTVVPSPLICLLPHISFSTCLFAMFLPSVFSLTIFFSPFVFFLTVFTVCFLPLSLCCVFSSSQFLPFVFFLTAFAICLPLHSVCYLSSFSQFLPFVFFLTAFAIWFFPHSLCYVSSSSQFLPFIFFFTAFTIGLLSHSFYHLFSASQSLLCLLPYSFWPFIFFLTGFTFCLFPHRFIICPSSQVFVVFLSIQLLPIVFFSQFLPSSQLFPSVVYLATAFFSLTLWALSSLFACVQHSPVDNLRWSKFRARAVFALQHWLLNSSQWKYTFLWSTYLFYSRGE